MNPKKRMPLLIGIVALLALAGLVYIFMLAGSPERDNGMQIVRTEAGLIDRISFGNADGEYSLLRADANNWYIQGSVADSAAAAAYIQVLLNARCAGKSDVSLQKRKPFAGITVSTSRGNHTIRAFTSTGGEILLISSDCAETVLRTDSASFFGQLYRPASYFQAAEAK